MWLEWVFGNEFHWFLKFVTYLWFTEGVADKFLSLLIKIGEIHLEVLLSEVIFEMMFMLWRFCVQTHMFQDFSNHFGIFNGRDNFQRPHALAVQLKHAVAFAAAFGKIIFKKIKIQTKIS